MTFHSAYSQSLTMFYEADTNLVNDVKARGFEQTS